MTIMGRLLLQLVCVVLCSLDCLSQSTYNYCSDPLHPDCQRYEMDKLMDFQSAESKMDQIIKINLNNDAILTKLKEELAEKDAKIEELEKFVNQLNQTINANDQNNRQPKSAFSAYMTVGYVEPNNSTDIVVPINGVNLNLNGDYNSETSTYTCPFTGIYYFSYSVYSSGIKESQDDRVYAFLGINGELQNEAYCQTNTEVKIYCQATNSDTIHCNQGDRVQIRTSSSSTKNQIYGSSKYKRTTFTGHLLYVD